MDHESDAGVPLGRSGEAVPLLEKDLRWLEADKSTDPDDLGEVRFALARALRDLKREPDRAAALATRARDDFLAAKDTKKAEDVERWLRSSPASIGRKRNALGSRDY